MSTLFWAGSENSQLTAALLRNGVTKLLYSFAWIQDMRRETFIAKMKQENPYLQLILDSGAFTYSQKALDGTMPPPKLFFRRYKKYLREFGHLWDRVMELDVDSQDNELGVSVDQVDKWREELLDEFPHLNITPVYHSWRGTEAWQTYLDDPRIKTLAIGRSAPYAGQMRAYVDAAHRVGKTVHGLAITKYNTTLKWIPFDSCDSSSWTTGQRFGNFFIFQGGKLLNLTIQNRGKQRAKQYRTYMEARGCDPDKIINGDRKELLECNIRTWVLVSKRLELMRKQRGENLMEETGEDFDPEDQMRRPLPSPKPRRSLASKS